jgi:hypothetical protein
MVSLGRSVVHAAISRMSLVEAYKMIGENLVVTSYEWEAFRAGRVSNGLSIDCDPNVLIVV